jgi:hypothetical protein
VADKAAPKRPRRVTTRKPKLRADPVRIEAAKEAVKDAAPPAKRAEHLKRVYPELADAAWVAGNPAPAARLRGE